MMIVYPTSNAAAGAVLAKTEVSAAGYAALQVQHLPGLGW